MITVQAATGSLRKQLAPIYDVTEAEAITMLVLSDITGFSKAKLKAYGDHLLNEAQQNRVEVIIGQLKTGLPVQYALGHAHFWGLEFEVNESVLIPRPETEELVAWIIESADGSDLNILDIGTGSGCIAVSLKYELKAANVWAIDVSAKALRMAKKNAANNHCSIGFIEEDILGNDGLLFENKFDIVVSNPPYVTPADKLQMHGNVVDFEPHIALFVPEDNPLLFYNAIADFAVENLKENGLLFFEINESYAQQTVDLLEHKLFKNIELRRDIRGKYRMIKAELILPANRCA